MAPVKLTRKDLADAAEKYKNPASRRSARSR